MPVLLGVVSLVRVKPGVGGDGLAPLDGVLGGDVARVAQQRRVAPELAGLFARRRQASGRRVAQLNQVEVLHQVVGGLNNGVEKYSAEPLHA